ncbi:MAG: tetratricopeptide repeat protein [Pyrinomonadaceae bacterium]
MSEFIKTQAGNLFVDELANELSEKSVKIRVSPNSYFIALFLATFFTGFLIYTGHDTPAGILFLSSWISIPILIATDKISFDGVKLARTGIIPRAWSRIFGTELELPLEDIEQVETQALRAIKRGGNVFYRYRTSVRGGTQNLILASGSDEYREMVRKFFPFLSANVLDNRSLEIRDYINQPKAVLQKAQSATIPTAEFLETTVLKHADYRTQKFVPVMENQDEIERSDYLRQIANELRVSGNLIQSLEAFRRALLITPRNGWLIFEFARCLHSFAGAEKDPKLERKALAALRLAELRAENDNELLSRLGESYFQYGDWKRAQRAFLKAIDNAGENFRSIRGLAEIALREGKIAHVIHHFSTANRFAETPSLRRWTQNEADYFSRLNDDEEYMELEISRVNMVESLERGKGLSFRIALIGFPWIILGIILDVPVIINIGWAVSMVSLLIWVGMIISKNLLSARVPLDFE